MSIEYFHTFSLEKKSAFKENKMFFCYSECSCFHLTFPLENAFLMTFFTKKKLSHCEMQKPCVSSTFWFVFPRLDQTDMWSFGKSVLWWKHNQFLRNSKIILTLREAYCECQLMQYFLTNWQWTVFLNDLCLEFKSYCERGSLHWGVTFS